MSSNDIVHLETWKREDSIDKKNSIQVTQISLYICSTSPTMFVLKSNISVFSKPIKYNKYHCKLFLTMIFNNELGLVQI